MALHLSFWTVHEKRLNAKRRAHTRTFEKSADNSEKSPENPELEWDETCSLDRIQQSSRVVWAALLWLQQSAPDLYLRSMQIQPIYAPLVLSSVHHTRCTMPWARLCAGQNGPRCPGHSYQCHQHHGGANYSQQGLTLKYHFFLSKTKEF